MAPLKKSPAKKTTPTSKSSFREIVLTIYLYLVSLIALIIFTINIGMVVHLALETWIFPIDEGVEYSGEVEQCGEVGIFRHEGVGYEDREKPTEKEVNACLARAEERVARRQHNDHNRTLSSALAFMLVSFPVWVLHYRRALKIKR